MNRAAFLDRDGVINEVPPAGHVATPDELVLSPGAGEACRRIRKLGYKIIIVTNQGGIARGYYSLADYFAISEKMKRLLMKEKAFADDIFFCPYHPAVFGLYQEQKYWRKPQPGMILAAAKKHRLNLRESFLAGDNDSDIEAGRRAGIGRLFLLSAEKRRRPKGAAIALSLRQVADYLQSAESAKS